ncbi:hypothetical protein ACFL6S_20130, partial [Candidatus Poribacteria bacterium]
PEGDDLDTSLLEHVSPIEFDNVLGLSHSHPPGHFLEPHRLFRYLMKYHIRSYFYHWHLNPI